MQLVVDNKKILQTQMKMLYGNIYFIIAGNIIISSLLVVMLWNVVMHTILITWLISIILMSVYRVIISRLFSAHKNIYLFRNLYLLASFFSGCAWGYIGLFDVPLESYYFILFIICGLTVNVVASSSVYLPACYFFILPATLPLIFFTMTHEGSNWHYLSWMAVAYLLTLVGYSHVISKSSNRSVHLRFKNLDLIEQLTEQKAEVTKAKELAEKANISKSHFLAAASHDLRQPLHSMGLFVGALKYCNDENERMQLYQKLESSQESLLKLFDALLDISKLDAGAVEVFMQPVDADDAIDKVIRQYEIKARNKNLKLFARPSKAVIYTDPLWFERILRNLLSNAIRYTEKGSIFITCRSRNDRQLIQVWDSGCGIEDDHYVTIFDEFKQLHNTKQDRRQNHGLGLGLAIVKRLCHLMGHTVSIQSVYGKGSVFSLMLKKSTIALPSHQHEMSSLGSLSLQGKDVLLIDDDVAVSEAMSIMLKKWGCNVYEADSLDSAIRLIDKINLTPDILVTDYRLQDNRTGIEVIEAMQARYETSIPSLLVTADTSTQSLAEIKECGCPVLHKPVKPVKLRIMMNSLCLDR
ncbi:MAG: hybrid sensor histidine kinase/response regulator [Gammaproteobacteria bacterium]|nr:hybrid sensor histidine kinase/response regulator [Gammaproteobacteria bacterium]